MANKTTIIKAIGAIKTIYSYFAKDTDIKLLVDTWSALLSEYSDEEVDRGLFEALKKCQHPPVPADVIAEIEGMKKKPSGEELWVLYRKALKETLFLSHRLNYTYVDYSGISQGEQAKKDIERVWRELPEEIKMFLGDKSELIYNARSLNDSDFNYERSRFQKTLPIIQERKKYAATLEGSVRLGLAMKDRGQV